MVSGIPQNAGGKRSRTAPDLEGASQPCGKSITSKHLSGADRSRCRQRALPGEVGRDPAVPGEERAGHRCQGRPKGHRRGWLIASLCLCAVVLAACGSTGWYVVDPTLPNGRSNLWFMISGFWYTILLSATALAMAVPGALLIALCGLSSNRSLQGIYRVYVEVIRAIPLLVLILWVYYGLPDLEIRIALFWSGALALAIGESAFLAEVFRGGIQSIPRGQIEAAKAISLNYGDTMRYVILPQAIRRILPALGNQFIYVVKMSALVSVIGAPELTRKANELIVTEYRALEIYTILALEYLVLVLILSAGVRWMERRMGADERVGR